MVAVAGLCLKTNLQDFSGLVLEISLSTRSAHQLRGSENSYFFSSAHLNFPHAYCPRKKKRFCRSLPSMGLLLNFKRRQENSKEMREGVVWESTMFFLNVYSWGKMLFSQIFLMCLNCWFLLLVTTTIDRSSQGRIERKGRFLAAFLLPKSRQKEKKKIEKKGGKMNGPKAA